MCGLRRCSTRWVTARALCRMTLAALIGSALLGRLQAADEAGVEEPLRVGLARTCITPEVPLWLHGYASKSRFRPFEGKLNDLFAKALAIEDARGLIQAFEESTGGVVTYNGRMVENLHVESARRTLSIAEAIRALAV